MLTELKCDFAHDIYYTVMDEIYGTENCRFEGYKSWISKLLDIDLLEAKFTC